MNLVRNLVVPSLTCLFGLGLVAGCPAKTPEGTTNPPGEEGAIAPADPGAEGTDPTNPETGDPATEGDPTAQAGGQECEAQIADAPTLLFDSKVLIRPPVNVELVEQNPGFATTMASAGFVSACEATVKRMSLLLFQSDPSKSLESYMTEFVNGYLAKSGFTGGTPEEPTVNAETDYHQVVSYPATGGQPATKLYIAQRRIGDFVFTAVYEASPEEFEALVPSFKESAQSILLVP